MREQRVNPSVPALGKDPILDMVKRRLVKREDEGVELGFLEEWKEREKTLTKHHAGASCSVATWRA